MESAKQNTNPNSEILRLWKHADLMGEEDFKVATTKEDIFQITE